MLNFVNFEFWFFSFCVQAAYSAAQCNGEDDYYYELDEYDYHYDDEDDYHYDDEDDYYYALDEARLSTGGCSGLLSAPRRLFAVEIW